MTHVGSKQNVRLRQTVVTENFVKTLSDMELLNLIELRFSTKPQEMIEMNEINRIYKSILLENGMENEELSENYKKHLKELLKTNLKDLVFVQSKQRNQPENVMMDKTHVQAVSSFSPNESDMKSLWKISKQIRKEILAERWKLDGDFESYKPPHLLFTFVKWVLIGPQNSDDGRTKQIESIIEVTTEVVSQNMKSNRQTQYHQQNPESFVYNKIETPLNIGLGLYMYHVSRIKKLVNFLSDLKLGANYQKVIDIKKDIVQAVLERKKANNGTFIPSTLKEGQPIYFAIDNVDLKIDTLMVKDNFMGQEL